MRIEILFSKRRNKICFKVKNQRKIYSMENKDKKQKTEESRIIEVSGVDDRVLRNESDSADQVILNDRPINAENAVPPKAWDNQKKAYDDAFENNKNQELDDDR